MILTVSSQGAHEDVRRAVKSVTGVRRGGEMQGCSMWLKLRDQQHGFLGGSGVKNPPANTGDLGSIPGPGKFPTQQDH